ncbi:MAG: hydroxymethylglutaryl-CoA reductase [Alcanivorax sediminis]|uniref:hydroxymethylglutaryl-CoA reductase n=1 Tax=Alcanivorax sediminis TaxID=2663008 RepID=UPI003C34CC2A
MNSRAQAAVLVTPKATHTRETDISLRLSMDGQSLVAALISVDKHQLVVSVESTLIDSRHAACACDVEMDGQRFTIPVLEMSPGASTKGGMQFVMQPGDCEESRARLWQFARLVHTQTVLGEPCQTDPQALPKIPGRGLYSEEARQERLAFAREVTGASLQGIAETSFDPRKLVSNIEGLIGSVEIPLGIAGPLYVTGKHASGYYYAPLATSEGALVASATRGATAMSRSGGVRARVLEQRMLRVPMFQLQDLSQALFFADWIADHSEEIADQTARYSNYARLRQVRPQVIGRAVHVHFVYETGDAAGQNMTTTCTWQACQWIMSHMQQHHGLQFENFLVESNLSNDKKVTYQSFLNGRGIRVLAETVITARDCEQVLKVTPQQLVRAFHNLQSGGIAAGMVGSNINVANIVAAMFTATGQDIACVHESAIAHLNMEVTDQGDLYATMTLPSLVIGTVGGGTNLPQQREALELMQCAGPGNAHKLAEIIASFCLALDLSTLSAIACDQFARAHEKLGRNRPEVKKAIKI